QGIRIPTLGYFDIVAKQIKAEDQTVTLQWPVFRLARNLVNAHNLMDDKEYLPGHKELEPLKHAEVAADAFVSWEKVQDSIQGTMSLMSQCLLKGGNVALVLRDVG
ncbi:CCD81 protein, partial [Alectura lathami]|nr:CCD81 protein [Alectura lathami]